LFPDLRPQALNSQRGDLPYAGADVHRIHLGTRRVERLAFGEFTPNTGAGRFDETNPIDPGPGFDRLGYGILNLGPCPLPGGRVAFTSNRNGFVRPKGFTNPTLQLYVMDEDGSNVTPIAPMTIGSALHPTVLQDGRLMFSSPEGCPLDRGPYGWFLDDLKPTLTVTSPAPGANAGPVTEVRVGAADAHSGLEPGNLSIVADFAVGERAAGSELADLAEMAGDGIWTLPLSPAPAPGVAHEVRVSVWDVQGNVTRVVRRFTPSP